MVESSTPPRRRSTSRSRRKHPSFSDLRLAPLTVQPQKQPTKPSVESPRTPGSTDPTTSHAYKHNHSSYLAGRSAPSTPGILSRSSSRRQPYGGLSRKSVQLDDDEAQQDENIDPSYFAYQGARPGPVEAVSGYLDERPKSLSESGLNSPEKSTLRGKRYTRPLSTAAATLQQGNRRSARSGTATPTARSRPGTASGLADDEDSWLTHATSFTNSLIAESKGQAWISTHSSTTNLQGYTQSSGGGPTAFSTYHNSSSEDEADDETPVSGPQHLDRRSAGPGTLHLSATAPALTAGPDPTSPLRSPSISVAAQQGWGSRFGSRAPSASNSRRGSRVGLRGAISGFTTPGEGLAMAPVSKHEPRLQHLSQAAEAESLDDEQQVQPVFVDPEVQREMEASLAAVKAQRSRERRGEGPGYFDGAHGGSEAESTEEDVEEEVARLARTPGFGLSGLGSGFGIIDRLVGMSGFAFDGEDVGRRSDEDSDADVTPMVGDGAVQQGSGQAGDAFGSKQKRRSMMVDLQSMFSRQSDGITQPKGKEPEGQTSEGGWNDAAWLLSVASKVIL